MTDKELLEYAAKATGYVIDNWEGKNPIALIPTHSGANTACWLWNPLTDDGDALRLAMKLGLTVYQWDHEICVCNEKGTVNEIVARNEDAYAATRRAIVLAAAEIGKDIP